VFALSSTSASSLSCTREIPSSPSMTTQRLSPSRSVKARRLPLPTSSVTLGENTLAQGRLTRNSSIASAAVVASAWGSTPSANSRSIRCISVSWSCLLDQNRACWSAPHAHIARSGLHFRRVARSWVPPSRIHDGLTGPRSRPMSFDEMRTCARSRTKCSAQRWTSPKCSPRSRTDHAGHEGTERSGSEAPKTSENRVISTSSASQCSR